MLVDNPEVTLEEEAHGFPEDARDTAQLDWALVASVVGDDGNHYWFNIGAMSLRETWGNIDFWAMSIRSHQGSVVQPAGSVYKVADFPDGIATDWHFQPRGALTATKSTDQVAVNLGDFNVVCKPDNTWHYSVSRTRHRVSRASGCTPVTVSRPGTARRSRRSYTPHSVSYGYFWSGASKARSPSGVGTLASRALVFGNAITRSTPARPKSAAGTTGCGSTSTSCPAASTR